MRLIVLHEGNDKQIIQQIVRECVDSSLEVKYYCWSQLKKDKVNDYLRSIKKTGDEYIFIADIDTKKCKENLKQWLINTRIGNHLDRDKIIVVIKEIESWFAACIKMSNRKKFGFSVSTDVNNISKEAFCTCVRSKGMEVVEAKQRIIDDFSLKEISGNTSLDYFVDKMMSRY